MTISLAHWDGELSICLRAENKDGDVGDLMVTLRAGQKFAGYTFDELWKLPDGENQLEPR